VVAALVGEHRDPAALAHPAQAVQVAARDGLLDQLEVERLDAAEHADCVGRAPRRIRVDANPAAIRPADALEVLHVAGAAELHLDRREIVHGRQLPLHLLRARHAAGDARERRARGIEAEQLPDRHSEALADPVVQGGLDRGTGGTLPLQRFVEAGLDGLQRERIVPEVGRPGVERGVDQRARLAVVVRW